MVLEEFDCFVDGFRGEIAYILMKNGDETFWGQCQVSKLTEMGIREHRRFKLRTVETDEGIVTLEYEAIPDKEIDEDAINKRIEEALGDE